MRRLALRSLVFSLVAAGPALAAEAPMSVRIDEARPLRLNRDFEAVIVGNPDIADVVAHDARMLVVTGRSFGETNLIVLDAADNVILSTHISVAGPAENRLVLYRGSERRSYHCPDECQAAPVPGDDTDFFGAITDAFSSSKGPITPGG